jgi:copper chaperone NosL
MNSLPARCIPMVCAHAPEHGGWTRWRYLVCALWVLALAGCHPPDGNAPAPVVWDRDTCAHCGMVISDRGYAAEAWVEAEHRYYRFDDIGCMVSWLHARGVSPGQLKLWVADYLHHDEVHWLDARTAWYRDGLRTPMDYGFGATADAAQGTVDFDTASARMLERDEKR